MVEGERLTGSCGYGQSTPVPVTGNVKGSSANFQFRTGLDAVVDVGHLGDLVTPGGELLGRRPDHRPVADVPADGPPATKGGEPLRGADVQATEPEAEPQPMLRRGVVERAEEGVDVPDLDVDVERRPLAFKVLIILVYTLPALAVFLYHDQVRWGYGLVLAAGSMLGA